MGAVVVTGEVAMQVRDYSDGFRADWFVEQFETGRESPLLDFKASLYKLDDKDNICECARDIIAFANVARRTNKKCYILFGVGKDETERRVLYDVRDQFPGKKKPQGWDNPNVSIHDKQVDGVEKVFNDVLQHWIDPDMPDLSLQYGKINGVFVSYLEIKPKLSSRPFSFKCDYLRKKDDKRFNKGDVFVRKGASTVRVPDSEVSCLYQWDQVAYLEQAEWRKIIQAHLSGEFEKMWNLSPYFHPKTEPPDLTAFDAAMQALDAGKHLVVITGHAGSGKTVLLHRLAYALAKQHNLEMPTQRNLFGESESEGETIQSIASDLEVVPPFPVPIFMSLREAFENIDAFERGLLSRLQDWIDKDKAKRLDQFFNIPGSRWIILLDGLDELHNRENFAPYLRTWISNLPANVQVVITSRPAYAPTEPNPRNAVIGIKPLTTDDVFYLLMGRLQGTEWENRQSDIERWFSEHADIVELLACPRALDGFVRLLTPLVPDGRISLDQDRVELSAQHEQSVPTGNDQAPIIEVDPNLVQEELLHREDLSLAEEPLLPHLASAVRAITDFMRQEEVKRQESWGQDTQRIADQAKGELDEVAWYSDWSAGSFDCREHRITGESCRWNEDIGFIHRKSHWHYHFMCDLLHHYLCAEYAWDFELKDDMVRDRMNQQRVDHPATRSVLDLLNELRQDNGRELINL
jgi:energy-coupling factor transporter ATP-binding protein EcfA2